MTRTAPRLRAFAALAAAAAIAGTSAVGAQDLGVQDRAAVLAREEFRRGVQAYNRFSYNESILSFEKALSHKPGESLILDWLGKAYYKSGLEDTALRQWQAALAAFGPASREGLVASNRIETVRNRRILHPVLDDDGRYVESGRYPSRNGDILVYGKPTSVLPNNDGTAWIVAYGSNELVRVDPNGIVRQRVRGPLAGFDRPYDVARGPDGRLFVTEYKGSRVSVLSPAGEWQGYIGSRGRGPGGLVGPQNLAVDEQGYLYVVDFGNKRVAKFAPDGVFVLSFGGKDGDFPGFKSPTGIAAREGRVFVADPGAGRIYSFDGNGLYGGHFGEGELSYPESLRFDGSGRLVVADTGRILLADPGTGSVRPIAELARAKTRVVSADVDANGSLVAANFDGGEVSVLSRMEDLASGLFVQVERVSADDFPRVTVEISVQDRSRRPVVGLDQRNFLLSEEGKPVASQEYLGASHLNPRTAVSVLYERSGEAAGYAREMAAAGKEISSAADVVAAVVVASEVPAKAAGTSPADAAKAASGKAAEYGDRWKFDLALRLAAAELLPSEKKRAVFFVTTGRLGARAFDRYGLSELTAFLSNNGIAFYAVLVGGGRADPEIAHLCDSTGGEVLDALRPEGLASVARSLSSRPSGYYTLRYSSNLPTDFGRAYLPLEIEAYLMDRSGRDAVGYFAPLE